MLRLDKRFLQRIRIPLGFLFAIVFVVFARPFALSLAIGGGIALLGLLIRAWASGHIRKASVLAVTGPYAFTRNPLYVGSFIMGVGFTVAAGVWWLGLVFAALFIGIYLPVIRSNLRICLASLATISKNIGGTYRFLFRDLRHGRKWTANSIFSYTCSIGNIRRRSGLEQQLPSWPPRRFFLLRL